MISWRCIGLVLLFSVSPLSATDQFPARPLDRAVDNDPARERVLVMHDGTVQRGPIEKTMTGYVLTMPQGKLVIAFDRVRLMADDLPTAYREQSKACANQALPHIEIGRTVGGAAIEEIHPGRSRTFRLVICLGGMVVASKTWIMWLWPSLTHSSVSSGVMAMP